MVLLWITQLFAAPLPESESEPVIEITIPAGPDIDGYLWAM